MYSVGWWTKGKKSNTQKFIKNRIKKGRKTLVKDIKKLVGKKKEKKEKNYNNNLANYKHKDLIVDENHILDRFVCQVTGGD